MSTGVPYASGIQRATMSDGVRNEHQTGKRCSSTSSVSREPPSTTKPSTPRVASVCAESSPIIATSWLFGWQTTTWPAGAFESSVHQPSSVSWRVFVRSRCPETVQTGPASLSEGSSGLIAAGSTTRSWPIILSTSCTAPV